MRRRRGGARLPRSADHARSAPGESPGGRHRGGGLRRSDRAHGSLQGALRSGHCQAHARRGDRGCRHLPRTVGAAPGDPGHGADHGGAAPDPGARQPGAGNRARRRARGATRCDHRHGPQRLSQPGQQRPVLPLHLPRRARRRRDHDQRPDEDRVRARDRRGGPDHGARHCRRRIWRVQRLLRARVHHPEAVRLAPCGRVADCGRPGGHGERRRHPADRRSQCLPRAAVAVRVPLRADHEADLRAGARAADARGVRRRRGGARAARRGGAAGRAPRPADPDRTAGRGAQPYRAPRAAVQRRARRRAVQSRERSALPRLRQPTISAA